MKLPFDAEKEGPLVKVPLFPDPDKSVHVVPDPEYELELPASR